MDLNKLNLRGGIVGFAEACTRTLKVFKFEYGRNFQVAMLNIHVFSTNINIIASLIAFI